ncbi:glycosyltransferase [Chitinimonas sp.]|uniref:glycosyltransferase n=1 Tax=Chitinimonas sp. TaxID=1934313 RepID=UPI0035AED176
MPSAQAKANIVLLIDGLPGGGAERVVLTLAQALAAAGQRVTIVSLQAVCEYPIPAGVDYLVVADTGRGPLRKLREIARRAALLDAALLQHFGDTPIDLAISNLPKTDRIVAASRRLNNAWFCLHCALTEGSLGERRGWRRRLKLRQLRHCYGGRKLITVCQALQDDVRALGIRPAQMVTIYNPFALDDIRTQSQAACPLDGEDFLLHVGRLNRQKRHDRLLAAFKLSPYSGKLVLLGSGSADDRAALLAQIAELGLSERVQFAGFQENPYRFMRAARALVLSSDYEGFGNVLVEALACGTPVISTNCPVGPNEILQGNLALGLADLSVEGLARAIDRVLAAPPQAESAALDRFALATVAAQYASLVGH